MTTNNSSNPLVQTLEAQVNAKRNQPRKRMSRRRCFHAGCEGWITAEYHGEFQFGKVRYRQYMNCQCNECGMQERELVRSQVDGQPELNGTRFLLPDPDRNCWYEPPGFGQSILPFLRAAHQSGVAAEVVMGPMMMNWLELCRQGGFERVEPVDLVEQPTAGGSDGGAEC